MDSLEDFEKSLAAEKAQREERRHHKHRHRRDDDRDADREDRHRRRRDDDGDRHERRRRSRDEDGHRHKRSRHHHDDEDHRRHSHHHEDEHRRRHSHRDEDEHRHSHDKTDAPVRDAWMVTPSAIEVEHIHRPPQKPTSPTPEPPKRIIHSRKLNKHHLKSVNSGNPSLYAQRPNEKTDEGRGRVVDYSFGDAGSAWRMTKLKAVYASAEETGRTVEDVALDRYGSLELFDDAREEEEEMERRRIYKGDLEPRHKPTGDLHRERAKPLPRTTPSREPSPRREIAQEPLDQTALNRLRAQMMKAKLRRAPNAAQLEEEYARAAAVHSSRISAPEAVVLGVKESRLLAGPRGEIKPVDTKRGRERGQVEENEDMSISDMLREERRTKGQSGGEALRLAERIAKDGKFANDLEYMDDNAAKLAKRVHKSELNLKNTAVHEFQKMSRILDSCPLCHKEDQSLPPLAPVIALGTRVFLTLPTEPEVSPGGAVVVPLTHRANLLECDDDEWEELRNFMKSLTRMYHDQGREVLFYENAASQRRHAALVAVPIPYEQGATAPAFFREAFLSSDEEWSQHKKIIDTQARAKDGLGRLAFRRSIAKEMPYFHVWFSLDGGLGHVVEDERRWPRGDLFAREVIGGMVDAEPHVIKKQGRWTRGDERVDGFKRGWRKFDWTRVLSEA